MCVCVRACERESERESERERERARRGEASKNRIYPKANVSGERREIIKYLLNEKRTPLQRGGGRERSPG